MNLRGVVCPLVRCCPRFAIARREPIELAANDNVGARATSTPEDKKVNRHNPIIDYLRGSETQLASFFFSFFFSDFRKLIVG